MSGLGVYAFWVEPYWIEVTRHSIAAPVLAPLKIAHITDIHTSGIGRREKTMLRLIEAENPDLILISGDSINVTSDYPGLHEVLLKLRAPLGVWLVRGNHEDWWPIKDEKLSMSRLAQTCLLTRAARFATGFGSLVSMICTEDLQTKTRHSRECPIQLIESGCFIHPCFSKVLPPAANSHLRDTPMVGRFDCRYLDRSGYLPFLVTSCAVGMSSMEQECMSVAELERRYSMFDFSLDLRLPSSTWSQIHSA